MEVAYLDNSVFRNISVLPFLKLNDSGLSTSMKNMLTENRSNLRVTRDQKFYNYKRDISKTYSSGADKNVFKD